LSNLDHSLFTLAPGESGNPLSRHYDDLLISWRNGTPETIVKPEEGVPVRTTILIPSTGGRTHARLHCRNQGRRWGNRRPSQAHPLGRCAASGGVGRGGADRAEAGKPASQLLFHK